MQIYTWKKASIVTARPVLNLLEPDTIIEAFGQRKNRFHFLFTEDSLSAHMMLTTKDSDNDTCGKNCSDSYGNGWWFKGCQNSNLNGVYYNKPTKSYNNVWKMMIRSWLNEIVWWLIINKIYSATLFFFNGQSFQRIK